MVNPAYLKLRAIEKICELAISYGRLKVAENKPLLKNVAFIDGFVVATDGYRLLRLPIGASLLDGKMFDAKELKNEIQKILPKERCKLPGPEVAIYLAMLPSSMCWAPSSEYPKLNHVLPTPDKKDIHFWVDCGFLLDLMRAFINSGSNHVEITINPDRLHNPIRFSDREIGGMDMEGYIMPLKPR